MRGGRSPDKTEVDIQKYRRGTMKLGARGGSQKLKCEYFKEQTTSNAVYNSSKMINIGFSKGLWP